MKLKIKTLILAGFAFLFVSVPAYASYTDITVYDGYSSKEKGWHGEQENNEVEPGATTGQAWDLEAFYYDLDTSTLGLVAGFDLVDGGTDMGAGWVQSGDIFLETSNDGDGYYDYVLDMDFDTMTYTVYDISGGGAYSTTHGGPSGTAGLPLSYTGGGKAVSGYKNLSFTYVKNLTGTDMVGDLGSGRHNAAFVDLSFLAPNTDFGSFFTMTCGNDVIKGSGTTASGAVPEPATILLLGFGLAALGATAGKKKMGLGKELRT